MSYISFAFFFFVAILLLIYYIVPLKIRPYILLCGSLYFYITSGWKNAVWLVALIILTYFSAILIEKFQHIRKVILLFYLLSTVGGMLFVKFINYALNISSIVLNTPQLTISVLVPLGLSFFTLQAIGYVIDIFREKYTAERNIFKVAFFLSFFPLVVQGPISRMNQLSKSLFRGNRFDYKNFTFGLQLSFFGLFQKLVIANRAACFADPVFSNYQQYSGLTIIFAILLYTIQIYTDFSGCVNICRGISQMFGVELIENFDHPYFAVSIKDFWRRWHISLSSWLRDYVYISLGGNRKGSFRKYLNLIATFLVSGIWHGVGLHYLVWGLYHGILQIIGEKLNLPKKQATKLLHIDVSARSYRFTQQLITFVLVAYGWLLFRANGLTAAFKMTQSIFYEFISITQLNALFADKWDLFILFVSVCVLLLISVLQNRMNLRETISKQNLWFRWGLYLLLFFSVVIFGVYGKEYQASDFLYMQF